MKPEKLVLVHGRDQAAQDPARLRQQWIAAIRQGLGPDREWILDQVEIEFPYYGDILQHYVESPETLLAQSGSRIGLAEDPDFLAFEASALEGARHKLGLTDEQVEKHLSSGLLDRGDPLGWEWVQAILRALDDIPGVDRSLLEMLTRDAFVYLYRSAAREAVNAEVQKAIPDEPCIVIGHSLGTMVAFDALRKRAAPAQVPLYLTVGSPMGSPAKRSALAPIDSPAGVTRWYNAFDERDVVALYPLDERHFPVQPPIDNDNRLRNRTPNHHGVEGYLSSAELGLLLHDALTGAN